MQRPKFTPENCQAALEARSSGLSMPEVATAADITVPTLRRWLKLGRRAEEENDYSRFAAAFDMYPQASQKGGVPETGDGPISESDLVRLLEKQARNGSIRAIAILLDRKKKANKGAGEPEDDDAFDALDKGDEIAAARARRGS